MKKQNEFNLRIVAAVVLMALAVLLRYLFKFNKKYTKDEIAKQYNVSKPTLNNWIRIFHKEMYPEWFKMRKVPHETYSNLRKMLGDDMQMVMNKAQMCDKFSTNNKYLKKVIHQRGHEMGIDIIVWNSCSVFPPNVVHKIRQLIDMK